MVFAIAIYGEKNIGMLLTNIFSITKSNPKSRIIVFWQDIKKEHIGILSESFSNVEFIKTNFNFSKHPIKKISSKTILWEFATRHIFALKYKYLCLIDTDVLVVKNISDYFNSYDFDIMFTYKEEKWPLNTGVLLAKNSLKSLNFFERWKIHTFSIINDERLFRQSTSKQLPYGGADQMALYKILGFVKGKKEYKIKIKKSITNFIGIPCKELNETNSTKITRKMHIIHYKAGWHPILLEGKNFTKNRTKRDSWEMYIFYLKTYNYAVKLVNKKLNSNYYLNTFNIKVPFYLTKDNLEENKILSCLYYLPKSILKQTRKCYVFIKSSLKLSKKFCRHIRSKKSGFIS